MKKLNVGLIGAGFMGKAHSLAYMAMPMFFWPAPAIPVRKSIVDVTDEIAAEAALRFGFEKSSSDWRSVVEDPEIDIIDIYQDVKWYFPKMRSGQLLCTPLASGDKPMCGYFVKEVSRQSEIVDYTKCW